MNWRDYGPDMSEGQEWGNRPAYINSLAEWLASVDDLHERLSSGARVADVGCGGGWSSIAIARAYPDVSIDGFDLDVPAIERARRNAEAEGLSDRVRFHAVDPAEAGHGDVYDVVTAFECIHDMPQPVPVLRTMRSMAAGDGIVLVMDENVAPEFIAPGDEVERIIYGVQHPGVPPGRHVASGLGGHGCRDASRRAGGVCAGGRVRRSGDPADRRWLLAVLSAPLIPATG